MLQQLWTSYNWIALWDDVACLTNLTTPYRSHNVIKSFLELDKLKANGQREFIFMLVLLFTNYGGKLLIT